MDKHSISIDSRYVLNSDLSHFGIGVKYFQSMDEKIILLWKLAIQNTFIQVSFKIQLLKEMGIEDTFISKPNYVDLVNLVRSIQRAEGNIDCYRRGPQQCDRVNCVWRDHCLKAPEGPSTVDSKLQEHKIAANPKQEQGSLH